MGQIHSFIVIKNYVINFSFVKNKYLQKRRIFPKIPKPGEVYLYAHDDAYHREISNPLAFDRILSIVEKKNIFFLKFIYLKKGENIILKKAAIEKIKVWLPKDGNER